MLVKMTKTVFASDTVKGVKQAPKYFMRGQEYDVCKELAGVFHDLEAIEGPDFQSKMVVPPENKSEKRGRGRPRKNQLNATSEP